MGPFRVYFNLSHKLPTLYTFYFETPPMRKCPLSLCALDSHRKGKANGSGGRHGEQEHREGVRKCLADMARRRTLRRTSQPAPEELSEE